MMSTHRDENDAWEGFSTFFRRRQVADEHTDWCYRVTLYGLPEKPDIQIPFKVFLQCEENGGVHRFFILPFAFSMLSTALSSAALKMSMDVSRAASSTSGATA